MNGALNPSNLLCNDVSLGNICNLYCSSIVLGHLCSGQNLDKNSKTLNLSQNASSAFGALGKLLHTKANLNKGVNSFIFSLDAYKSLCGIESFPVNSLITPTFTSSFPPGSCVNPILACLERTISGLAPE